MQNQNPHVIKSQKPKQSNAWRSNSVPNVYKNLNHRVNHFKSSLSGDIETNPGPLSVTQNIVCCNNKVNSTKKNSSSFQSRQCGNVWVKCWHPMCRGYGIVSSIDLVNIMNIGNELYSGLSSLSRQS